MKDAPTTTSKHTPTKRLNKRQLLFINYWLDPNSETFGNTYQSGVKAGFSDYTARILSSNSHHLEWIQEAKKYLDDMTPDHVLRALEGISKSARADRDKINALDKVAKIKGMYGDTKTEVNITFANAVPRPTYVPNTPIEHPIIIDVEQ